MTSISNLHSLTQAAVWDEPNRMIQNGRPFTEEVIRNKADDSVE